MHTCMCLHGKARDRQVAPQATNRDTTHSSNRRARGGLHAAWTGAPVMRLTNTCTAHALQHSSRPHMPTAIRPERRAARRVPASPSLAGRQVQASALLTAVCRIFHAIRRPDISRTRRRRHACCRPLRVRAPVDTKRNLAAEDTGSLCTAGLSGR